METKICYVCKEEFPATEEYFPSRKYKKRVVLRNTCRKCRLEQNRDWVKRNEERYRKYYKEYYNKNIEKILENKKVYYQKNKEQIKLKRYSLDRQSYLSKKKQYHLINWEKEKQYRKKYSSRTEVILREKQRRIDEREKNREYQKNYLNTEKGREKSRIKVAKRRALRNNTVSTFTVAQWEESKEFFKFECAYCGLKANKFDQDHIVPLSKGGSHVKSNIIPSCEYCNGSKHVKDMEYWYRMQPFFSEERLKIIHNWIELNKSEYEKEVEQLENYAT